MPTINWRFHKIWNEINISWHTSYPHIKFHKYHAVHIIFIIHIDVHILFCISVAKSRFDRTAKRIIRFLWWTFIYLFFSISCCRSGGWLNENLTPTILLLYIGHIARHIKKHIPRYSPRYWHPDTFLVTVLLVGRWFAGGWSLTVFEALTFYPLILTTFMKRTPTASMHLHDCCNCAHQMAGHY